MPVDRDAIMEALLARLKTALGDTLQSSFRQWKSWDDVLSLDQPAMMVVSRSGSMAYEPGMPPENTIGAEVAFFARCSNSDGVPEVVLLDMLATAETALEKQTGEQTDDFGTTLGGLVWRCRITGYQMHQEFGQEQAALSLTIEMLVV